MFDLFLSVPLPVRLLVVGLVGWLLGGLVTDAIRRWSYFGRPVGPWFPAPSGAQPHGWLDRIPILGWWRLRRESEQHGKWFWLRPLVIEVCFPLALMWLYRFEVSGGTLPVRLAARLDLQALQPMLHVQFLAHAALLLLMTIATFIDIDERTIPDLVTVPGTLLALFGSALLGWGWLLNYQGVSYVSAWEPPVYQLLPMHAAAPLGWPLGWQTGSGLAIALLCYSLWCFGLADRRWIIRRGWRKAVIYFLTGLVRRSGWKLLLGLWLVGCGLLVAGYAWLPPLHWQSLLSSLIGIALTGLLVWSIRVVSSFACGMEALGFGDVTLMAMVGAFLGWQAAWMGFFAGVMAALGFVLAIWLVTRDPRTPFGPYLCLGSLLVLIRWDAWFNEWMVDLFALGPWLLVVLAVSLLLLGGMLWVWGLIKYRWLIRT